MDNKEAIEMIRCLIANYGSYLDDKTAGYNNHDLCKALMKAIKSLEAWNKVIEELDGKIDEQYVDKYDFCYQQGIEFALELIKKYKKEIEE